MVPLASRIRLLALRHRCQHTNEQPEIHRSICRRRGALLSPPPCAALMTCGLRRLTRIVRSRLDEWTSAHSAHILRGIRHLIRQHLNIRAFRSTRLKTSAFMQANTTRWRCRSSSLAWTWSFLACYGTSIGSTPLVKVH